MASATARLKAGSDVAWIPSPCGTNPPALSVWNAEPLLNASSSNRGIWAPQVLMFGLVFNEFRMFAESKKPKSISPRWRAAAIWFSSLKTFSMMTSTWGSNPTSVPQKLGFRSRRTRSPGFCCVTTHGPLPTAGTFSNFFGSSIVLQMCSGRMNSYIHTDCPLNTEVGWSVWMTNVASSVASADLKIARSAE